MTQAKKGDRVKVHYHGTLEDGSVFDSSRDKNPLEFELGSGMVIAGFDDGVTGLKVGEKKTIHIAADNAYGPYHTEMLLEIAKTQLPDDIKIEAGQYLEMKSPDGEIVMVMVKSFDDDVILLDANHPLAGQNLTFDLELVAIN
ncbi:MAG: FKBP-type peptidyl-prolyl cis-trans isomerase [Deltaproteobacteria bacterium]|nr:FKBP-type peptidyl-prolyl cis-trans isomerase [Deltaproteobacteria bacterium]